MRICEIRKCGLPHYGKGYCRNHYTTLVYYPTHKEHHLQYQKKYRKEHYGIFTHQCEIKNCNYTTIHKYKYCHRHRNRIELRLPLDLSLDCKKLAIHSCRGEKNGNWNGGTSEYPNHYLMKKNRLIILMHNPKCEYCGKKATQIHHKDENKANHKLSNLVPTCHKCNVRQSSKFYKRFGYTLTEITEKLNFTGLSKNYWGKYPEEIKYYLVDKSPKVCI